MSMESAPSGKEITVAALIAGMQIAPPAEGQILGKAREENRTEESQGSDLGHANIESRSEKPEIHVTTEAEALIESWGGRIVQPGERAYPMDPDPSEREQPNGYIVGPRQTDTTVHVGEFAWSSTDANWTPASEPTEILMDRHVVFEPGSIVDVDADGALIIANSRKFDPDSNSWGASSIVVDTETTRPDEIRKIDLSEGIPPIGQTPTKPHDNRTEDPRVTKGGVWVDGVRRDKED